MSKPDSNANYGIIGDVQAKAVAVGAGAIASVNEIATPSRSEFNSALAALREQIRTLQIPKSSRDLLDEDLTRMANIAGEKPGPAPSARDLLRGLVDKLKMVNVFVQAAAGFQEPVKKLAEWFHLTLPF